MKVVFYANTDWYLYNFRLPLMLAARERGFDVMALTPPGPFGERLERHGIPWRPIELDRRSLDPMGEGRHVLELRRALRQMRPDLLHNFTIKCAIYGSIVGRLLRTPAVVNSLDGLGNVFTDGGGGPALRLLLTSLMRLSMTGRRVHTMVQNEGDRDFLVRGKIVPASRLHHYRGGTGVDLSAFQVANEPDAEAVTVLFASRLLREKGLEDFVEAARIVRRQRDDCLFLVAGTSDSGNPGSISEDRVRTWDAEGIIRYMGHRDDMPALLAEVSLVALPTYYGEGVPRILIEAAAAGRPIVASDILPCRAVVDDGVNGIVVPPRDPVALAAAITALADDPDRRRRMGAAGRRKAEAEFDQRHVIAATLDLYATALGAKASA